ncbi:hypothetical protein PIB30_049983 [Stylosanthes scabra]|uniref:Uncharacterized protein n=1 Tax=Stylosanthes scabra TaxID=79078 RepID=A0ABU6RHU0_9FABA|nr:hypothetical protein [Stylosanthes scabra]
MASPNASQFSTQSTNESNPGEMDPSISVPRALPHSSLIKDDLNQEISSLAAPIMVASQDNFLYHEGIFKAPDPSIESSILWQNQVYAFMGLPADGESVSAGSPCPEINDADYPFYYSGTTGFGFIQNNMGKKRNQSLI